MRSRRWSLLIGLAALAVVSVDIRSSHGAEVLASAQAFVARLAVESTRQLATNDITEDEKKCRFRTLLATYFDVPWIGRWVLGRHWHAATVEQRRRYLRLFEEMIFDRFAKRLVELDKNLLDVKGAAARGKRDVIVRSIVHLPQKNAKLKLLWYLRQHQETFRVIDVIFEGVSFAQTQRVAFASVIRNSGGSVEALLEKMSETTQRTISEVRGVLRPASDARPARSPQPPTSCAFGSFPE